MTALTNKLLLRAGYADGLLGKKKPVDHPSYAHGYENGEADRAHVGLCDSWCGDSNRAIDIAVYPAPARTEEVGL